MIFLLNGPPSAGKDQSAWFIRRILANNHDVWSVTTCKAASPLFESIPSLFAVPVDWWHDVYANQKNTPQKMLHGRSPRQVMIWLSEVAVKPEFGEDFFGICLGRTLAAADNAIVSDCGFAVEVDKALEIFEHNTGYARNDAVHLIRLNRDGCSFDGDSRNYLEPEDIHLSRDRFHIVENNGYLQDLYDSLAKTIKTILGDKNNEQ